MDDATKGLSLSNRQRRLFLIVACAIALGIAALVVYMIVGSKPDNSSGVEPYEKPLNTVISMHQGISRQELLDSTCGVYHDEVQKLTEDDANQAAHAYLGQFGEVKVVDIGPVQYMTGAKAKVTITVQAQRSDDPQQPLIQKAEAEFDSSSQPWKVCDIQPIN
ncbi:hypothetical protein OG203_16910 [Nocardia sp. NBC_01499]|uniref:Rv0361 family membrane protein n=1 Tax=Nocardia sp. NBC_01499 TaxID=2903597 RepID=UPI0038663EA7